MPRLLDLFCGAGGAAMGYARAGFDVIGIDIHPQPRYPFPLKEIENMTCRVCGHAKWHELAKASLNPVALIGFIESTPDPVRIVAYVLAVTGINRNEMDATIRKD